MYITWRHYRDYTEEQVFPVWHALSMLVPIYQFFRLHAHVRVYQELMAQRRVPSTLNAMRTVGLFAATGVVLLIGHISADRRNCLYLRWRNLAMSGPTSPALP